MLFSDSRNISRKIHAGKTRSAVLARENAQVPHACQSEQRAPQQRALGVPKVALQQLTQPRRQQHHRGAVPGGKCRGCQKRTRSPTSKLYFQKIKLKIKKVEHYTVSETPELCERGRATLARRGECASEGSGVPPGSGVRPRGCRPPAFRRESLRANPQHSGRSAAHVGFIFKLLSPNSLFFLKARVPPCCGTRDKTLSWAHAKTKSGTSPATHFAGTSCGAAKPCHRTLRRLSPRGLPTKTSSTFIWSRDRQQVTEQVNGYGC